MQRDAVGPVDSVCRDEVVQALNKLKTGKSLGLPLDALLEFIAASGEVGIQMLVDIFQIVLDGLGMPV